MKVKVLLADDEPFILQGLAVLIDWEKEGCEIVKTASNGKEALDYLKENQVDLIIADIRMPIMTGLELLKTIREKEISDAYFIILSGYNDFQYAQKAIRYSCMDYILKPVKREALTEHLHCILKEKEIVLQQEADSRRMHRACLIQNLLPVISGSYEPFHLEYVLKHLKHSKGVSYIHICLDKLAVLEEMSDQEVRAMRNRMYESCRQFLGQDQDHCMKDIPGFEEDYEIGFVYCDYMAQERGFTREEMLEAWHKSLNGCGLMVPVVLLVGKRVEDMARLSYSYSSACVLRSFKSFRTVKGIYYYEEEVQAEQNKILLCKQSLDRLIQAVEQNDRGKINSSVDGLFQEMEAMGMVKELVNMNINYLLFQLIHLAVEQDESVNQEEVMLYISEHVFDSGIARGSRAHMRRFACEYAQYLIQLRKNVSRGVLMEVEKEIKEHYAENLTLRELSQKYFINSSYLGQIFRKQYGQSFKDYLSSFRIDEAAVLLVRTDKKISRIAEEVGYHDTDYFISKFIELKGCTPSRYRKNAGTASTG